MRQAMLVREALVPYLYSYARIAYDEGETFTSVIRSYAHVWLVFFLFLTGLSLLRPMYYEYPEMNEAYTYKNQVSLFD